jgi:sulfur carrier protein ThiS
MEKTIEVKILLRGTLRRLIEGGETSVALPEGATCEDALLSIGIDWREVPSFGFVSVNGMRVMITDTLNDGDLLKAFSRISGG